MRRYGCTHGCGIIVEWLIDKDIAGDGRDNASRRYKVGVSQPWQRPAALPRTSS